MKFDQFGILLKKKIYPKTTTWKLVPNTFLFAQLLLEKEILKQAAYITCVKSITRSFIMLNTMMENENTSFANILIPFLRSCHSIIKILVKIVKIVRYL